MSRFSGKQHKGAMRAYRELKREEARERQAAEQARDARRALPEESDPGDE